MNKVTIITASYNCKNFITKTYESIINQTYKNYEWIIVDDCSIDGSYEFIKNLIKNNSNIILLKTEKNSGAASARNIGLKNATGKYITFIDSDDFYDLNYLEEQIKFIKDNGPIITAGYRRISENSNTIFMPRKSINYKQLLKGNDASCLTTMYDREIIGELYFEHIKYREDFVFWLTILKRGYLIKGNQKVLANYTIHKSGLSNKKIKLIKPMYFVYHNSQKFNFFKSCYYIFCWAIYGLKKYKNVK